MIDQDFRIYIRLACPRGLQRSAMDDFNLIHFVNAQVLSQVAVSTYYSFIFTLSLNCLPQSISNGSHYGHAGI